MATTKPTIVGVFDTSSIADNAVHALENAGISSNQIYYSSRQTASNGGFLAGLKNLFTGDETTGGVTDDMKGMGLSNEEAQYYESEYQAGHAVVALRTKGREKEAAQILQTHGAHVYGTRGGVQVGTPQTDNVAHNVNDEQQSLKLREEQLNVEKRKAQVGEVGLHKKVVSQEQTINVPVTHEEVYIERHPVTGQVDNATPIGEDEHISVPVSKEQVNVTKNTVTTGEVEIGKRVVQENQQVKGTVRREEAHVEQQGNVPLHDATKKHLKTDQTEDTI